MPRRPRLVTSPKSVLERLSATKASLRSLEQRGATLPRIASALDSRAVRALIGSKKYPLQIDKTTVAKMQNFLFDVLNKNVELSVRTHQQAKELAKKKGISESRAFALMLEEKRPFFEKRVREKMALEQMLFVVSRHRQKQRQEKPIRPVEPTRIVRQWGRPFYNAKDLPGSVVKLAEAVSRIPMVRAPGKIAEAYYGLPTAEETILVDGILTVFTAKGKPAWGCGMQCDVMNAVLNGWGMENWHVRTSTPLGYNHSVVLAKPFRDRQLLLVADPFRNGELFLGTVEPYHGSSVVSQVGQNLGSKVDRLKGRGKWALGKSLSDHVSNFVEFREER